MTEWQNEILPWLSLHMIPRLGNTVIGRLIENFGDPERVFDAGIPELMKIVGIKPEVARNIAGRTSIRVAEKELKMVENQGARIITFADSSYPELLRQIHNPPIILYAKGNDFPKDKQSIAIVGSRNPTHYGFDAAETFGFDFAIRGVTVISGMAKGIDSAAHMGCLRGGGFTVAVIGTGIDVVYPAENKKLFKQIAEKGVIFSEFSMGSPPEPWNFPIRNRIISGLCEGIVVVEATKKSGSLITASLALEQNREVFAVPGSIHSFKSTGTHHLIKQGACLAEKADDVLEELGFSRKFAKSRNLKKQNGGFPSNLDTRETRIYEILSDYPIHMDQIMREGKFEPGEAASILMEMELKGLIKQLPGKMFVL
ncbi:MAG TPA: DNA-protecting protein DprA [Deltaproteobacteria bacterium]|nr:DNA-protecting protein DprA [Deltaproteobacteria bacterium]